MSKTKSQLETELRSLRAKLANAEGLSIERLNDINRLQTARREDMQLHDNLQDKLLACEAERDEAMSAAAELRDRVGNLEAGIADRNAKVTRLHKERDEARSAEDYARNVALDDIAKAWKDVEDARRERDAAISAKAQAEVERYAATQERDAARKERDAKTRECIDLVGRVRDLDYWKSQYEDSMCKYRCALSRIDHLIAQRDTAEREREEYAGQLAEAESKRDEARAAESKAEAEWGEAMQELEVVRARLTGAETAVESLLAKRDEVEAELAAEQTRSAQYAAKLVEKGAAVSFLEGQVAAVEANLKSASDQLVSAEVRARSAESRANYWETRARDLMRPWWRRVLDKVFHGKEGGAS